MSDTQRYRQHLEALDGWLVEALERARAEGVGLDGVLFHSGRAREYHRDDREVVFWPSAHYRRWCPLGGPEHVVLAMPGRTPRVVRVQPTDYWFETAPPMEASYWQDEVDLLQAESFERAIEALGPLPRVAYVGDSTAAAEEAGIDAEMVEPEALMAPLDWFRAIKTEHEVALIAVAAERAAAGHMAARSAFEAGASERDTHRAYLAASDQLERDLPYENIIAFDDKSAILHYHGRRGGGVAGKVLLVDAGAQVDGYASDLTRTWARPDVEPVFAQLLAGMDRLERELVAMVTPGRPYPEIHQAAHRGVAKILVEAGVLSLSVDEAIDRGFGGTFMPHGVGHHIGLQVHDVGGQQAGPDGGEVPPGQEIPYLRTTRTLEPGHVVTIEPGLYFIPILLDPLRESEEGAAVDWELVDRLVPCGGIRIEDDVLCTEGEPRDLSRGHLPGPAG